MLLRFIRYISNIFAKNEVNRTSKSGGFVPQFEWYRECILTPVSKRIFETGFV